MSNRELDLSDITLEDIDSAIKLIEKFVKLSKRAEKLLRQLRPVASSYGYGGDIFKFIMSESFKQRAKSLEELPETELTEEEEKLIEKLRKKKAKEVKAEV